MTDLLLDTHTFLWWRSKPETLNVQSREAITDARLVFVSVVSAWEAAIKIGLGRLQIPEPFESGVEDSGFEKLPITFEQTERLVLLPPHHRDPFDRMLVVQALAEGLTLVTRDRQLQPYGCDLIWA